MPTECSCGQTRCLACLGTCPVCGDDISNHLDAAGETEERNKKLKAMLKKNE